MKKSNGVTFTKEQKLAVIQRGRGAEPPVSDPQLAAILGLSRERIGQLGGRRGHAERSALADGWHKDAAALFETKKYTTQEIAKMLNKKSSLIQKVIIQEMGYETYDEIKESVNHERLLRRLVAFFRRHKPVMSTTLFSHNKSLYAHVTGAWKSWKVEINQELENTK